MVSCYKCNYTIEKSQKLIKSFHTRKTCEDCIVTKRETFDNISHDYLAVRVYQHVAYMRACLLLLNCIFKCVYILYQGLTVQGGGGDHPPDDIITRKHYVFNHINISKNQNVHINIVSILISLKERKDIL